MSADLADELRNVLAHYDLGELIGCEPDQRGTVNVSHAVETLKDGRTRKYFLRRYKPDITHDEILFEHSLVRHLVEHSPCPVARLHPTRSGETFFMRPGRPEEPGPCYYAVFDFIDGEPRYTWIDPHCTQDELEKAGQLLASFHASVSTLTPGGRRAEGKILDLLETIEAVWIGSPSRSKGTVFDGFLADNFDLVRGKIAEIRVELGRPIVRALPEVIIHSDFHPGNLIFDGDEICGLVDFDWSKIDLRAFDVALAAWYFCVSWQGSSDGALRLDDCRTFLAGYQRALVGGSGFPGLSSIEIAYLPDLIKAADVYVLYWSLRDYFAKDVDPEEFLVYLRHCVSFLRWFDGSSNRDAVSGVLAGLPRP